LIYETPLLKDIDKLMSLNIPVIIQAGIYKKHKNLGSIIADSFHIGEMAAEYYMQKNFKSYAFYGYKITSHGYDLPWSEMRYDGFCERLKAKGFNVPVYEQIYTKVLRLDEKELMGIADWLKELVRPVAVFACNDGRACDVIEACKLAHLEVPDEVAVLGVDNDEITCNFFNPPISSIVLNAELAGYEAAELLDKMMRGDEVASKKIIIHPKYVVERQSTNVLQIEDEDIAKAINYIQHNCMRPLRPLDVAQAVCMSVRTLDRRFKKIRGWPVHKEITRIRMRWVCNLLVDGNLTITEIANKMGFSDPRNLSRAFKREMGMSPLIYQEKNGKLQF
jgi:LacI family transcriptional regulator